MDNKYMYHINYLVYIYIFLTCSPLNPHIVLFLVNLVLYQVQFYYHQIRLENEIMAKSARWVRLKNCGKG